MERKTEQLLRILNFCVCIFGFLCYLVAFLTTTWNQFLQDGYMVSYGLFFICISSETRTDCALIDKDNWSVNLLFFLGLSLALYLFEVGGLTSLVTWMAMLSEIFLLLLGSPKPNRLNDKAKASQAFGVLVLVTYFSAAVSCLFLLLFCHLHWKKRLLLFASIAALTTCVFVGLCLGLFASHHTDREVSYGYSFFLACGSGCMVPFVAILSFILSRVDVVYTKIVTVQPKPKEYKTQVPPLSTNLKQTKFHNAGQASSSTLPPVDSELSFRAETPLPLAADSAENKRRRFALGLEPMFRYKKPFRLNNDLF